MVAGRKVEEFLRGIVGNVHIEDLGKPFIATAVDISSGIGYHFTKGPLVDAIRASISIPGVFEPVEANGGFLVDGGVRQNLPLRVLVQYNPDILIGADVLATDQLGFEWNEGAVERTSSDLPVERDLWERIKDRFEGETPEETQFPGMTFLMSQVFEIITREGSHKEIEETKPDLVVQLDTDEVQLWEFWRGRDAIGLGFKQSMPVIAEFLAGRSRLSGFKTRWKRLLRRNL
jgi:NTE family protein